LYAHCGEPIGYCLEALVGAKQQAMNSRLPLALATPLLIALALFGLMGGGQRQGAERLQAMPALLIAAGLLIARAASYGRHRQRLLRAVKEIESGPP
jgi:hypothetical protein